jgi:myo-inositol catabolism protein IolS
MQLRRLGDSEHGLDVSVVALGMMSTAASSLHADIDERYATETVHAALDAGVTLFDTAPMYGDGESERRLGRALRASGRKRESYVVATKFSGATLGEAEVVADCEASLQRLGMEHIDLYQLHWFKRVVPLAETMGAMEKLRKAGKVRHLGICNAGPLDTTECARHARLVSVQVCYSLVSRGVEFEMTALCQRLGLSLLCYSPLAQGLLTGQWRTAEEVPAGRSRSRHFHKSRQGSRHGGEGCEKELFAALENVRGIAGELGVSMAQLATAWLAHQPGVGAVLCGASRAEQASANAAAAGLSLSPGVLSRLDAASGPVKRALGGNLDPWQGDDNSRCR